ncbi:hypothetical protein CVIRNUC_002036 [Coccomyxa viridis]|uniref:PDZ domain-containing protein n=1 Tax=Coccomyxa viridis TaxID=1274662 RepID=A0AAV1HYA0_9CHLO|nr:hypothetical protein CVIRNUC_002036 [Coccomyxa viridis]
MWITRGSGQQDVLSGQTHRSLLRPHCSRCRPITSLRSFGPLRKVTKREKGTWRRASETSTETASVSQEDRTSYRIVQVTLKKPMGLILADSKTSQNVFVEEVIPDGNAEKSGKVQVGDILSRCSATVLKDGREGKYEKEGYGQRLYTNWEKIMFDCEGEDFDTVMKALSSNTERWGIFDVTLELKRYLSQANKPALSS